MVTTSPAPSFLRQNLRILLVMGLIGGAVFGTLLGLTVGPRTPTLGENRTGDPGLMSDVEAAIVSDRGYDALSVGRIRDAQVTFAGLGTADGRVPTPQTPFELGSITKTFTGLLLADAVQRGELQLTDLLAQHLPELADTPAGGTTLFELATHSSGLPSLAPTGGLAAVLGNGNPYDVSVAELLEATKTVELKNPGSYAYSNLGMSLLGHAEARAAGATDWPTLARERLLTPLGLASTSFALSAADIPENGVRGHRENGWRAAHWYGAAYTPAGSSTWTTAEDVMRYAAAVLNKTAPGLAALEPEAESSLGQVGLAWQFIEFEGRDLTWHNGGTGGMHTMLALDRQRGQAVIVLGNTTRDVDRLGLALAAADGPPAAAEQRGLPGIGTIVATVAGLAFLVSFVLAALRGGNRLAVAIGLVSGLTALLILLGYGPWTLVPAWVWGTMTGAAAALAAYAVLRARDLPNAPAKRPALAWLNAAVSLFVLGFVVYAL